MIDRHIVEHFVWPVGAPVVVALEVWLGLKAGLMGIFSTSFLSASIVNVVTTFGAGYGMGLVLRRLGLIPDTDE